MNKFTKNVGIVPLITVRMLTTLPRLLFLFLISFRSVFRVNLVIHLIFRVTQSWNYKISRYIIIKTTVWVFNTNRVWHVCRTTVLFGTLNDDSLDMNNLALNNCFSYRNVFQNGVNASSKMFFFFFFFFCHKAQNFV